MPFTRTLLHESTVEMEIGATQVGYRGAVDLYRGRISGNLIFADGTESLMELTWMDRSG
jgi:hypothetical protein